MGLTMKGAWSKYGPAGLLVMLSVGTALGSSKTLSASTVFNSENFQDHLVLLYKGAYVAYSGGKGSERDLPECRTSSRGGGATEACNLSHRRYWQPPLVERLCRCPGHTACPLHNYGGSSTDTASHSSSVVQHISNRAHLQFCNAAEGSNAALQECASDDTGLRIEVVERREATGGGGRGGRVIEEEGEEEGEVVVETHTRLRCLCPAPRQWQLHRTSTQAVSRNSSLSRATHLYTCHQLPQCISGAVCSHVRPDTHESYFSCSCPPQHLCLVGRGASRVLPAQHALPHYGGSTYRGYCTPTTTVRTARW